jgi:hypothetical protein
MNIKMLGYSLAAATAISMYAAPTPAHADDSNPCPDANLIIPCFVDNWVQYAPKPDLYGWLSPPEPRKVDAPGSNGAVNPDECLACQAAGNG